MNTTCFPLNFFSSSRTSLAWIFWYCFNWGTGTNTMRAFLPATSISFQRKKIKFSRNAKKLDWGCLTLAPTAYSSLSWALMSLFISRSNRAYKMFKKYMSCIKLSKWGEILANLTWETWDSTSSGFSPLAFINLEAIEDSNQPEDNTQIALVIILSIYNPSDQVEINQYCQ